MTICAEAGERDQESDDGADGKFGAGNYGVVVFADVKDLLSKGLGRS
jgi:hypothetical protein